MTIICFNCSPHCRLLFVVFSPNNSTHHFAHTRPLPHSLLLCICYVTYSFAPKPCQFFVFSFALFFFFSSFFFLFLYLYPHLNHLTMRILFLVSFFRDFLSFFFCCTYVVGRSRLGDYADPCVRNKKAVSEFILFYLFDFVFVVLKIFVLFSRFSQSVIIFIIQCFFIINYTCANYLSFSRSSLYIIKN